MLAACYVGDRTVELLEPSRVDPVSGKSRWPSRSRASAGRISTSCTGLWTRETARPAVLGHEMSGSIAAVGDGVDGWSVGDHVTVMPLAWCGHCPACRAGHSHICHNLNFLGIDSPGSMQPSCGRPGRCARRAAFRPPARGGRSGRADGGRGARCAPLGSLRPGEKTLVVGGGPIGLLVACVARAAGADVLVLELSEQRRALAETMGLGIAWSTRRPRRGCAGRRLTTGPGSLSAFEVSGSVVGLDTAIDLLAVAGGSGCSSSRSTRRRRRSTCSACSGAS